MKHFRIGSLVPSSNTTQEIEFRSAMPANVSLHSARLGLTTIEAQSTIGIAEQLERESRKLADAEVDVVLLAATAPSSRRGLGYDRDLIRRMEQATGRPAITASTALLQALEVLDLRTVAVAAPWTGEVNAFVVDFIEAAGHRVAAAQTLGLVRNAEIGNLPPDSAFDLGASVDRADADAVVLLCGNWPTKLIIDPLEKRLGKPVLSTNQVSLWAALRLLGHNGPVAGYGALLAHRLE